MITRTKDLFLFNYVHFKEPGNSRKEQHMAWELFTSNAKLRLVEQNNKVIMTCGYEIPLGEVIIEKKRIDLVAYDEERNLYIIETKFTNGSGSTNKAAEQVHAYAEELLKNIARIDQKFQEFKGDSWNLNEPFRLIVLAPQSYYNHKRSPGVDICESILFLTFKQSDEYTGLDSVRGEDGFVDLIEYHWKR
jgi:Holliday junction resolvase-like predicted endonuclease